MSHVILSIGSNIEAEFNIEKSKQILNESAELENIMFSSYYYSLAEGFKSNNKFINIVAYLQTELSPHEMLEKVNNIEQELNRKRDVTGVYIDRTIDIDIILWDKKHIHEKDLIIPHPRWRSRHFVMNPFRELISRHKFIRSFFKY